tara:strand:- start:12937 stop:13434 length:498 start_codon:yes stop_codon:yes gene_type:complete
MGYQKLQVGRATDMTKLLSNTEDTVNLYNPITLTADALTAGTTGLVLVVAGATFITDGVTAGDLVIQNSGTQAASRVASVDSETQITVIATGIFTSGERIVILLQSTEPAVLYVGTSVASTGTLKVTTMGGDDVTFTGPIAGTFLPVQVKRVWAASTSTDILALF